MVRREPVAVKSMRKCSLPMPELLRLRPKIDRQINPSILRLMVGDMSMISVVENGFCLTRFSRINHYITGMSQ